MDNFEDDSIQNLKSNQQVSQAYLNSEVASDVPSSINDGASAGPSTEMTIKSALMPAQYLTNITEKSEQDSEFQSSCVMESGEKF